MLTYLHIQGLAVIESLAIEFKPGFNIITGETGAGKSILIKALGLMLGAKASAETVRSGFSQAVITGQFIIGPKHSATDVLMALGVPFEVEQNNEITVLVRRQINAKGRSQAWVNDVAITNTSLRELGNVLIDVFAQHENHSLLNPHQHLGFVDQFLDQQDARLAYENTFRTCWGAFKDIEDMIETFHTRVRDRDYLVFRANELSQFGPSADDYEATLELCQKAEMMQDYSEAVLGAQACLEEGAGGEPVSKVLREVARHLGSLKKASTELSTLGEDADDLAERIDELSFQLGRLTGSIDLDESDVEAGQARLADYQSLMRKFGVRDIESLLAEEQRLQQELSFLESAAEDLMLRLDELLKQVRRLESLAKTLSAERRKAGARVKKAIETELNELAMPGAKIGIELSPVARAIPDLDLESFDPALGEVWADIASILSGLGESGAEKAQFMLSSNPGEPAFPLHKIASGGEVSRIMLALKRALSAGAETCVLVFDEIDTGISGKVADIVGRKMRDLSRRFQVISISHLAQVAAYADTHFLVRKFRKKSRTESEIVALSNDESAREVARLLSGTEITTPSLANAHELIERARSL